MFYQFLFKRIDNAQLIVFRVFYGFLVCAECFGAIATGWVKKTFIDPKFTFSFIGFEWLQPLPGNGMYIYFAIMGLCGVLITFGYKYRYSALTFAILWAGVYLMQKTSYNNHYYLLMLLAFIMAFLPANRSFSLDVKLDPSSKKDSMYNYVRWLVILQLFIVYTYASLAKVYGDWFDLSIIEILMTGKKEYPIVGELLQQRWTHKVIAIFGILFDLLIIPALLFKPTRKIAFGTAIFFHLFNSFVFRIGIFPYLSLAFCVFFFEPQVIRDLFLRKKTVKVTQIMDKPKDYKWLLGVLVIYFCIQLTLPVRHYFIKDDVLWTEEGHRLSWRMMLRSRTGSIKFFVEDKATGIREQVDLDDYLTKKQKRKVACYPDFIWQFAQHLKKENEKKGKDVSVFVKNRVRVNKNKSHPFVDPNVDLAKVPWKHFSHNQWVLPSKEE